MLFSGMPRLPTAVISRHVLHAPEGVGGTAPTLGDACYHVLEVASTFIPRLLTFRSSIPAIGRKKPNLEKNKREKKKNRYTIPWATTDTAVVSNTQLNAIPAVLSNYSSLKVRPGACLKVRQKRLLPKSNRTPVVEGAIDGNILLTRPWNCAPPFLATSTVLGG